ncbi:general transcription factor spTFIIE beta subunit [Venturia nashicola]|uniref:Transcription initiation factor IIE subunit beta n=1 Tax=Venturia nashicola TaxID=86259 RepID=A0A4Z1NU59_9PEZI|nr:general transcription factor spTFIIE beta subunit [Venturia nashicola]TLD20824.1 general transcription factor spTFIIE beta subunit [Venturia nashicola]
MSKSLNGSGVPSPSPSNSSAPGAKRKRAPDAGKPTAVQQMQRRQPASTLELLAQMRVAEKYLQDKDRPCNFTEVINYLSIQNADPNTLKTFAAVMQRNKPDDKIKYNPPKTSNGEGTYEYNPKYPIRNKQDLTAYLQKQTHAIGIKVEDLKDGWKDAVSTITTMGGIGELLVVCDKQGKPKVVWQDDKTLANEIPNDIVSEWHAIRVPTDTEELRNKLLAAGQTPSSAARKVVAAKTGKPKRKVARRGGRTTNVHMEKILKDYSNIRR